MDGNGELFAGLFFLVADEVDEEFLQLEANRLFAGEGLFLAAEKLFDIGVA